MKFHIIRKIGKLVLLLVIYLSLIGFGYQFLQTKLDDNKYSPPGKLVDIGGYRLHIQSAGTGQPTVILDAGMGASSIDWFLVQSEIAKFTRVCAYDRAGYGWSDAGPNPRTSQQIVNELHTLLETAKIPPPYILVGHSFGGINLRLYANQYPDEVAGIVLVDASHEEQMQKLSPIPFQLKLASFIDKMMTPFGVSRFLITKTYGDLLKDFPDPIKKVYIAKLTTTKSLWTRHSEADSFEESLKQLQDTASRTENKPLIVISAGLAPDPSHQLPEEFWETWQILQKDLVKKSTQGQQIIAHKSGHLIPWNQPEIIVEAVRQLWEQVNEKLPENK